MKLRFTGTQRRHADRAAARLDELNVDAVLSEIALLQRDVNRRLPFAHRTGGEKHLSQWRSGVDGPTEGNRPKRNDECNLTSTCHFNGLPNAGCWASP